MRSNRALCPSEIKLRDDLLVNLTSRSGAASEVRKILLEDVASRPSFAAVAKSLRTPLRTLRRYLQLQSTSFRQLSDEFRIDGDPGSPACRMRVQVSTRRDPNPFSRRPDVLRPQGTGTLKQKRRGR
jgi:hypothetical protein